MVPVPLVVPVLIRLAAPPCGMAGTAVTTGFVPGCDVSGRAVPGFVRGGVPGERVGGTAVPGAVVPPSEAEGEPGFDGDTGLPLPSAGAGAGSGRWCRRVGAWRCARCG